MVKKIVVIACSISMFLAAVIVSAESDIKGAVINKSDVKGSANIGIGEGNKANMGAVNIKDSKVKGAVINKSDVKDSANIAIGKGNEANMGSVDIK